MIAYTKYTEITSAPQAFKLLTEKCPRDAQVSDAKGEWNSQVVELTGCSYSNPDLLFMTNGVKWSYARLVEAVELPDIVRGDNEPPWQVNTDGTPRVMLCSEMRSEWSGWLNNAGHWSHFNRWSGSRRFTGYAVPDITDEATCPPDQYCPRKTWDALCEIDGWQIVRLADGQWFARLDSEDGGLSYDEYMMAANAIIKAHKRTTPQELTPEMFEPEVEFAARQADESVDNHDRHNIPEVGQMVASRKLIRLTPCEALTARAKAGKPMYAYWSGSPERVPFVIASWACNKIASIACSVLNQRETVKAHNFDDQNVLEWRWLDDDTPVVPQEGKVQQ